MKPIIFSTPMVKAILDGIKTMTRRVVIPQPDSDDPSIHYVDCEGFQTVPGNESEIWYQTEDGDNGKSKINRGDILWVRETHFLYKNTVYFKADEIHSELEKLGIKFKWKSPYHLYRKDARIYLKVKSVKVERLNDITEEDAKAEGISREHRMMMYSHAVGVTVEHIKRIYRDEFQIIWNDINAKRGYSWESNPWVWVYEFEKINTSVAS